MRLQPAFCVMVFLLFSAGAIAAEPSAADIEFFETKVRPLLAENCFSCHSHEAKKLKGKFYADSLEGLLAGGETGPAIVPGKPEKSPLIEAVSYKNTDLQMPPKTKLSEAQVAVLTDWVKRGAPWPKSNTAAAAAPKGIPPQVDAEEFEKRRKHWAFQPVQAQPAPAVKTSAWPKGPIDQFILAKLEAKELQPAAAADKRVLIRRASFDIVGLPPTPEQVEAFVQDASPDAFAKVVDELLASPHYGERWGRHWLDLMRYGESRGHEFDFPIPNAYEYRDYVIRAINADVPYNDFVREHLAGDLLPKPRLNPQSGFNESIIGTGFWFLGEQIHSPVDIRQDEADRFDNMVDVTCKSFLGLTVACARCHDHKFDAIKAKDYYGLFGFLQSSSYRLARYETIEQNRKAAAELWKLRAESAPAIAKAVAQSMVPNLELVSDYLLAAREVLAEKPEAVKEVKDPKHPKAAGPAFSRAKFSPAYQKRIGDIALAKKVDPVVLGDWSAHLLNAASDASDPFHAWSKAACDARSGTEKKLAEMVKPIAESSQKHDAAVAEHLKNVEILVDYSKPGDEGWLPDDVSFGAGPGQVGEVCLGKDPAHPIERVREIAAAEFDSAFNGYKLAPGASDDPVGLGYPRAGRTIRTRSFAITNGRIFFLARGTGHAYAAVDKHALVNGPLHGGLIKKIEVNSGTFEWRNIDLDTYKDHRTHIEFTAGSPDFAVAMVIQTDRGPPPLGKGNRVLAAMLSAESGSVEALAKGYQRVMTESAARLGSGRLSDKETGADYASLANWIVQHSTLIGSGAGDVGKNFVEAQAKVSGQIKNESHLALAIMDGSGEDEYVMKRGSWKTRGENAPRQLLEAIAGNAQQPITRGSGRMELANRMVDPANPFITRVMVNRIWHHLFGRGIVPSVDNFGILGAHDVPVHIELLDYLATDFVKQGWSVKKMIREILLSSTYQMSGTSSAAIEERDPENQLLHKMPIRRLEGEVIRDSILAISGRFDPKMYGPSVPIFLSDFMQGRGRPGSGPVDGNGRRSIYLSVTRNFLSSMMLAFDTPSPFNTMGRRSVSNVPAQALILMNDPLVTQQALVWAKRVLSEKGLTAEQRISRMYLRALSRPPLEKESAAALAFLDRQGEELGVPADKRREDERVWADLGHVLMNYKEFIYVN